MTEDNFAIEKIASIKIEGGNFGQIAIGNNNSQVNKNISDTDKSTDKQKPNPSGQQNIRKNNGTGITSARDITIYNLPSGPN